MTNLHHDHLIIHCAATPPSADVDAAWVDKVHRARGWRGCGYNEVITRSGDRQNAERGFPTRKLTEIAAHVGDCNVGAYRRANWNSRSIGICLAGGVAEDGASPENNYTDAQWTALAEAVSDYWERAPKIERDGNTMGHRDLIKLTGAPAKACPCFSVKSWLDTLQSSDPASTIAEAGVQRREESGSRRSFAAGLVGMISRDVSDFLGIQIDTRALAPETHMVKPGDTLWKISGLYGVPLGDLVAANNIEDPDNVPVGTKLRIFQ